MSNNKGYVQLKGPFDGGLGEDGKPILHEFPEGIVKRVSVQLYNNWPFEAFNSSDDMYVFSIKRNTEKLDFIIGESGTLELDELDELDFDELSDLKFTHFSFNEDMPASTLIEIELSES